MRVPTSIACCVYCCMLLDTNQVLIKKYLYCSELYKKQIVNIDNDLFEYSLVKYFSCNRYYPNQKWIGLYTDTAPVQVSLSEDRGLLFLDSTGVSIEAGAYFHGDLLEIIKTRVIASQVEKFFAQENNPIGREVVQNGLLIIRKGEKYDESFYFSLLDSSIASSRAYYYQSLSILKNFCLYFLHKAKNIISESEKFKISYVVPQNSDEIFSRSFFKIPEIKKFSILSSFGDVFLSPQELNCLRLIAKGYIYAEIAQELNLQAKTVESYIQNIKNKLNAESRAELAQYYQEFSVLDHKNN